MTTRRIDNGASDEASPVRVRRESDPTSWIRAYYDRTAAHYDKRLRPFERLLFAGGREWVCSQAQGEVLEIAVGTGLNLPHYPDGITLTGIDLSPQMLEIARGRARELRREIDLRVGDAQDLPFDDASFDTVVSTLSLCTIPDERAAVAEARRVLRRGGRFLLLEHVRSPVPIVRLVQRALEPITLRLEGDHQLREPNSALTAEGFSVETIERSKLGIVERLSARKAVI
jgi:ubiquinone/menaquinone biosynthesis C-methylase UbiE